MHKRNKRSIGRPQKIYSKFIAIFPLTKQDASNKGYFLRTQINNTSSANGECSGRLVIQTMTKDIYSVARGNVSCPPRCDNVFPRLFGVVFQLASLGLRNQYHSPSHDASEVINIWKRLYACVLLLEEQQIDLSISMIDISMIPNVQLQIYQAHNFFWLC